MSGRRGLVTWSVTVCALAVVVLVARSGESSRAARAIALATLAAVVGVLATAGVLRRAICVVVGLLGVGLLPSGSPVLVTCGVLLAGVGLAGAALAGGWPGSAARSDAQPRVRRQEDDLWSRIDAGDDPTR